MTDFPPADAPIVVQVAAIREESKRLPPEKRFAFFCKNYQSGGMIFLCKKCDLPDVTFSYSQRDQVLCHECYRVKLQEAKKRRELKAALRYAKVETKEELDQLLRKDGKRKPVKRCAWKVN